MLHSFPNYEPVHFFMSGPNCFFLTHMQVSQETGRVVLYSLFKNLPQWLTQSKPLVFHIPSWITALLWQMGLHNSMRLWAMPCRATQDRWVIMKSSEKTWSSGEGNGNPLQYPCLENPMDGMKPKDILI